MKCSNLSKVFAGKREIWVRCPVPMARPLIDISQAFHQFICAGRKFPKFSEPSQTGRRKPSPNSGFPRNEDNSPLGCAASTDKPTGEETWASGTVYSRGWLRGCKPAMLSLLGPESLSPHLVAKLWSHWQPRGIYIPLCCSGSRFCIKVPFFLFPKGVSRAGCAVSSFMTRTPGPWVTRLCCDITPGGGWSVSPPLPGPRSKAVKWLLSR